MVPLIAALGPILAPVIKNLFPDPEARADAERQMTSALLEHHQAIESAAASVIKAEAGSKWALAAVWRPILMLTFVAIIANNYIIAPYVALFGGANVILDIPPEMWDLLKIGVGGYVLGRSGEKIAGDYLKSRKG